MQSHLRELAPGTIPVFTDGSALSNPGPCGAAAIVYPQGLSHDPVTLKQAVSHRSTSYHGELCAIQLALSYINNLLSDNHVNLTSIVIHSDCKAALDTLIQGCDRQYSNIVGQCASLMIDIENKGGEVTFMWIPGHAGISSNDLADLAAKEAATTASNLTGNTEDCDISVNTCSQQLKALTRKKWQTMWDRQDTGRYTHSLFPSVPTKPVKDTLGKSIPRSGECRLNRLRSGTFLLRSHPCRQSMDRRAGLTVSDICECTLAKQDTTHILLECTLLKDDRSRMMAAIEQAVLSSEKCPTTFNVDTFTLLGHNDHLPSSVSRSITRAVCVYLAGTEAQIKI